MPITGSCLCGTIRYEISGPFLGAGNCHCSMCRKAHGSAFATWAFVKPENFRWTSGEELLAGFDSSPGLRRCFCSKCGSQLVASHAGKVREVVLGSVDGDPGVRPAEHIFVGSKACWHEITDNLPRHEEWPPES
ncbi:glutathione-dependent formaldehyde-activating enzyme [compost metagenome]